MTRKHFQYAADMVKAMADSTPVNYRLGIAHSFANLFTAFNPRFDRHRFMTACGLG